MFFFHPKHKCHILEAFNFNGISNIRYIKCTYKISK